MPVKAETAEDALLMAFANYKLNNYEKMLFHVQTALKLRPDFPLSLHYRALALLRLGDLKGAELSIRTALTHDKDNHYHIFLLGVILWNAGDIESADLYLKKAISAAPKEVSFLIEYATFLIHRGKFEEALDYAYKAKSIDENAPKLNEVIKSAKKKEFTKGLDTLAYDPPFPCSGDLIFPYLKIGDYYLNNDYLTNAQLQYAKALRIDPENSHAMSGFATATRLKEGGFYHFTRSFALFLTKWYVILTIIIILGFLTFVALHDPQFMLIPVLIIGGGLVLMVAVFLIFGLRNMSPGEYKKILAELNVQDINSLVTKIAELETELNRKKMEQEAIQQKAKSLSSFGNALTLIFWFALLAQVALVNINVSAIQDIDTVDKINMTKMIMTGVIIVSIVLSLWLRTRSRAVMEELRSETGKEKE